MMLEQWDDYRLNDRFEDVGRRFDEVDRRLTELGPLPKAVAVLATELKTISGKIDELSGNPVAEARQSKQTLRTAVISAVVSSGVLVVIAALFGGPVH